MKNSALIDEELPVLLKNSALIILKMEGLELEGETRKILAKGKFSDVWAFLHTPPTELCRQTGLSTDETATLRAEVCRAVLETRTPIVTGKQLRDGDVPKQMVLRYLSTGCPVLDTFLGGGVPSQGVTELAGESASGKTQICLQLSLTAQLPTHLGGLDGGVVYVCTEDVFPSRRLNQLITAVKSRYLEDPEVASIRFGDNIYLEHASDNDQLFHSLCNKLPQLLSRDRVRLLVLDSTAALFRAEYSNKELIQRAKDMTALARRLHEVNAAHGVPVVCVNQVTDIFDTSSSADQSKRKFQPSLGLTWANLVTTRLMTSRIDVTIAASGGPAVVRTLEVLSAPHLPASSCHYYVDNTGVKGLDD